ncbi:MAG TPA: aldo/keto reductase [Steroidobacteraceae bacterium]|nr:aldo/keto reductase [Steroidobacteraceae bacterium]
MARRSNREISRRDLLESGVRIAIGALLAARLPAAEPAATALPLITKAIPASGEKIPAIGIGTDSFRDDVREEIRAELGRMSELGGSVIDTAAAYGDSEALIGDALASLGTRDKMFIATKLVAGTSAGGVAGADSFERSLQRLKTAHVDLLQVHNLNGVAALLPTMQEWKKAGKIRYIGVTTSRGSQHAEMLETMRHDPLDFIQVDYSIANRDAASAILPLAQERRIAVLVNLPFGRSSLFRQAAERKLPDWAAEIDVTSWAQYFLKYVISHPAVTCAIPGSTKVSHLEDNQGAGRGRLPDAAMRRRMEEYWDNKA